MIHFINNGLKTFVFIICTSIVLYFAGLLLITCFSEDFRLYQLESACVHKFTSQGYERKHIITGNGTCYYDSGVTNDWTTKQKTTRNS